MCVKFPLALETLWAQLEKLWNSDAKYFLLETGLCKQGTANKGFASAGDYYQSMREHKLLRESVANLHTDAFEQWHLERNDDAQLRK